MGLVDIKQASSIEKAIQECDRLGRDAFLKQYGFGKSRVYFLVKIGKYYDSKAIVAVAHKYEFPQLGLLHSSQFSGGEKTVGELLTRLGFTIERREEPIPEPGNVLSNDEMMRAFGVGLQGGMRYSSRNNLLLLISDPTKSLYADRWEENILHYTGMGKIRDQQLTSQNKRLLESSESDIEVHLCEVDRATEYTYVGEVELAGKLYQEWQLDEEGSERKVYMFPLRLKHDSVKPIPTQKDLLSIEELKEKYLKKKSLEELKKLAKHAKKKPQRRLVNNDQIIRNPSVVEYVKRVARGKCDLCEELAPFKDKKGEPYLECHHVIPLAEDGDDSIENAVALCPNCHRKMHSLNLRSDSEKLLKYIAERDS